MEKKHFLIIGIVGVAIWTTGMAAYFVVSYLHKPIEIVSEDGRARLVVSRDALPKGVGAGDIGIQPISSEDWPERVTNRVPSLVYELTPVGLTFTEPIRLSFVQPLNDERVLLPLHISDDGTVSPLGQLHIAVNYNKNVVTVSGSVTHFSYVSFSDQQGIDLPLSLNIADDLGEHNVGESFDAPVEVDVSLARVDFTKANRPEGGPIISYVFPEDGNISLSGRYNAVGPVQPGIHSNAPRIAQISKDTTVTRSFTCEAPGQATITYNAAAATKIFYKEVMIDDLPNGGGDPFFPIRPPYDEIDLTVEGEVSAPARCITPPPFFDGGISAASVCGGSIGVAGIFGGDINKLVGAFVRIYNSSGALVHAGKAIQDGTLFDFSASVPPGTYAIRVTLEDQDPNNLDLVQELSVIVNPCPPGSEDDSWGPVDLLDPIIDPGYEDPTLPSAPTDPSRPSNDLLVPKATTKCGGQAVITGAIDGDTSNIEEVRVLLQYPGAVHVTPKNTTFNPITGLYVSVLDLPPGVYEYHVSLITKENKGYGRKVGSFEIVPCADTVFIPNHPTTETPKTAEPDPIPQTPPEVSGPEQFPPRAVPLPDPGPSSNPSQLDPEASPLPITKPFATKKEPVIKYGAANTGTCGDGLVQNPNSTGVVESCDPPWADNACAGTQICEVNCQCVYIEDGGGEGVLVCPTEDVFGNYYTDRAATSGEIEAGCLDLPVKKSD